MTFTITPDTAVASVAQHIIDNHPRQQAATLLADMYSKQWDYMETAMVASDWETAQSHSIKLVDITLLAKQHHIYRDMMVAVASVIPAKR